MEIKNHYTEAITMLGTPLHFTIFQLLVDAANVQDEKEFAYVRIPHDVIAEKCGISKKTVLDVLEYLHASGLITIYLGSEWTSDEYELHLKWCHILLNTFTK